MKDIVIFFSKKDIGILLAYDVYSYITYVLPDNAIFEIHVYKPIEYNILLNPCSKKYIVKPNLLYTSRI